MKILNELLAAITFFTRIPVWKLKEIPAESYKNMICFWPLTGWLTAGITVLGWYVFSMFFPPLVSVILALGLRVMLTGGLHEDGLGDFFDGFGGGRSKADILRIMKDSHAGSYSVLGLIFYYLLLVSTLSSMPAKLVPLALVAADPFSRFIASIMMNLLPYARQESESKSKTIYEKLSWWRLLIALIAGMLPLIIFLEINYWYAAVFPVAVMLFVFYISKKKIHGYTGDVCGATVLLCELGFYVALLIR